MFKFGINEVSKHKVDTNIYKKMLLGDTMSQTIKTF